MTVSHDEEEAILCAMIEVLSSDDVTLVAKALQSYCHEGLELRVQDGWVAAVCSEQAFHPTDPAAAVFKLRDLVVEQVRKGSMGC